MRRRRDDSTPLLAHLHRPIEAIRRRRRPRISARIRGGVDATVAPCVERPRIARREIPRIARGTRIDGPRIGLAA
jgi:hypothetical protein